MSGTEYFIRRGAAQEPSQGLDLLIDDRHMAHSGLAVKRFTAGEALTMRNGAWERILTPLSGSYDVVTSGGEKYTLRGRESLREEVTDVLYLPIGAEYTITSPTGGELASPGARAERVFPVQYLAAGDVPTFTRGEGLWSREIRDFGGSGALEADRLLAVEVINPGGHWSGLPRHKHDEQTETESNLEEIYYFRSLAPAGRDGYGYIRVESALNDEIDLLREVRTGDVVLIPHGWHGPVTAPPGMDLYYLNVMAGPDSREWNVTNHPADVWVTQEWTRTQNEK